MATQDYFSLISIIITILVGIISWIVSAFLTKKSIKQKKLAYEINYFPIISKDFISNASKLKIEYEGELLPEPTLLVVDVMNVGNEAIENPPIEIRAVGATYVIPGYLEDVPPGYEDIWKLERTDAESSAIKLKHINPKQVVKARFLLDEFPKEPPLFVCPMKNLEVRKLDRIDKKKLFLEILNSMPFKFYPFSFIK